MTMMATAAVLLWWHLAHKSKKCGKLCIMNKVLVLLQHATKVLFLSAEREQTYNISYWCQLIDINFQLFVLKGKN